MSVASRAAARAREYGEEQVTGLTRYNLERRAKKVGIDPQHIDPGGKHSRMTREEVENEVPGLKKSQEEQYMEMSYKDLMKEAERQERGEGYMTDEDKIIGSPEDKKMDEAWKAAQASDEEEKKQKAAAEEAKKRRVKEFDTAKKEVYQDVVEWTKKKQAKEMAATKEKGDAQTKREDEAMRQRIKKEYGIELATGQDLEARKKEAGTVVAIKGMAAAAKKSEEEEAGISKLTGWRKEIAGKGGILTPLAKIAESRYGPEAKLQKLREETAQAEVTKRRAEIAQKMTGIKEVEQAMAMRRAKFQEATVGTSPLLAGSQEEPALVRAAAKPQDGLLAPARGTPGLMAPSQPYYQNPFLAPQGPRQESPFIASVSGQKPESPFLQTRPTTRDTVAEFSQAPPGGPSLVDTIRNGSARLGMKREAQEQAGWDNFLGRNESPLIRKESAPSGWDNLGGRSGGGWNLFGQGNQPNQKKRRGL